MQSSAVAPPRDFTPEELRERHERACQLERDVTASIRAGREAMWHLCRALHAFDEERGWSALGHEHLTYWLAQPDVELSEGHDRARCGQAQALTHARGRRRGQRRVAR